jgi:acyltransferase
LSASSLIEDDRAPSKPPRIATLDAARALGVVAMVFGHTMDAVLAPEVRGLPAMVTYWQARGLTAPLFMLVSGWAVTAAISRAGGRGLAIPRARLGRVLLLLAIGYGLRWPGWAFERLAQRNLDVWSQFLAFDALHTIALSLFAAALVLALPWTRREKVGAFLALSVLSVALGMRAPAPLVPPVAALSATLPGMAVAQALGGTSPFPLFPWTTYFFAGAVIGLVSHGSASRRALGLAAVGGALLAGTFWAGVADLPAGDPRLVAFRIGAVLLVLAALSLVPAAVAARLSPLGRASLGVYAIHVAVVYGWSVFEGLAWRIGPTRSFGSAVVIAIVVLGGSFALYLALQGAVRSGAAAVRRVRERLSGDVLAEP